MTTPLEVEVGETPKSMQKTINKIIKAGDREPLKAAFLTRVIEGLIEIADSSNLVDITSADSNYPLWQFTDEGKTLLGLEAVLEKLSEVDPWTQVTFFLNPNLRLENKTPC